MEADRQQADFDSQATQGDALQALRSASLPDEFWCYAYKVLPCPHGYRHSWTHCPFSHAGETARRRCPRTYNYLPDPCPNARAKRQCPNGDSCPYAHNTFEQWLHPARYRTRLCYLGSNCRRPTCFFAHSVEELRSVEESESGAGSAPAMNVSTLSMPPLPSPPPLPPPGSHASGDFSPVNVNVGGAMLPTPQGPAAAHPGMLQHMPIMCMPQPTPSPAQAAAGGGYPAGPGMLQAPRSPLPPPGEPLPPPHGMALGSSPQLAPGQAMQMSMAMAVRPHGGLQMVAPMHLVPPGTMYIHARGMAPVAPAAVHGLASPPLNGSYVSPFGAPPAYAAAAAGGGYYAGGQGGMPGGAVNNGRTRSWSTPGEGFFGNSAMTANASEPVHPNDAGFRAAGLPPGVAAIPAPVLVSPQGSTRGVGVGGGNGGGSGGTPRHMPAPSNRAAATARRVSTPANSVATEAAATAAAAAAAAAVAMRYPATAVTTAATLRSSGSGGSSPFTAPSVPSQQNSPLLQQQELRQVEAAAAEAALRQLTLSSKSVAAPPPTPAALNGVDSGSSSSAPTSAPISVAASPTAGSPFVTDADTAAANANAALGVLRGHSSPNGSTIGFSPVPSNSLADASAIAAAAADAAAPYQVLLQHVLRSASASAAEPPAGLLPALLNGGIDLYTADGQAASVQDRTSDPGPASLNAAIRRISSEMGYGAPRQSDPGHPVPGGGATTASGVQQLLLPLLQTVLTEGLASGQLELVNGQLQVKGASGSPRSGGGSVGAASRSRLSPSGSGSSAHHSASIGRCASPSLSVSSFGTE